MKKFTLTILVSLLVFSFTFAQVSKVNVSKTKAIPLPKGVSPAIPLKKPITPEVIKQILPDEERENDVVVQLDNLRITRIITSTPLLTSNTQAILFAVRDDNWKCSMFESEESSNVIPCVTDLKKPLASKELVIKITNNTILIQKNKQRAQLGNFQVNYKINDKINIYGFVDKDNYGIEALIVKKNRTKVVPLSKSLPSSSKSTTSSSKSQNCIQVMTPAYNPKNPSECKEFPTPCEVPSGWVKTNKCPSSVEY